MAEDETAAAGEATLERISMPAGQRVFSQGEAGDAAFIVQKGRVTLYQQVEGDRIELTCVGPGEIFGEMAVIDGGKRMATAVANEDCALSRVPKAVFQRKIESADRFLAALIKLFIKNIRESHRLFLRRPRSFRDHVRQTKAFSWNMRRFAGRIEDQALADRLLDTVERLDGLLHELAELAESVPDKRHDLIADAELQGVEFAKVIGSETRRAE